jgi:hypothetical protein
MKPLLRHKRSAFGWLLPFLSYTTFGMAVEFYVHQQAWSLDYCRRFVDFTKVCGVEAIFILSAVYLYHKIRHWHRSIATPLDALAQAPSWSILSLNSAQPTYLEPTHFRYAKIREADRQRLTMAIFICNSLDLSYLDG